VSPASGWQHHQPLPCLFLYAAHLLAEGILLKHLRLRCTCVLQRCQHHLQYTAFTNVTACRMTLEHAPHVLCPTEQQPQLQALVSRRFD